ncbi:MAG: calcium-binding protein [Magnetococcales bacterium]|nr:calcium-binding protein [Magnetococcales bacterium]
MLGLSVDVPNARPNTVTLVYSGYLQSDGMGTQAYQLAEDVGRGSNGAVRTIGQTEAGSFMNSVGYRDALMRVALNEGVSVDQIKYGPFDYNSSTEIGVERETSIRFVKQSPGDLVVIAPYAGYDRVMLQNEIPAYLELAGNRNINGIPSDQYKLLYKDTFEKTGSVSDALKSVQDGVRTSSWANSMGIKIATDPIDGSYKGFDVSEFKPLAGAEIPSTIPAGSSVNYVGKLMETGLSSPIWEVLGVGEAALNRASALAEKVVELGTAVGTIVPKVVNTVGIVGTAIGLTIAANKAYAAEQSGDRAGAVAIMAEWGAGFAGGLLGGIVAAGVVGTAATTLGLAAAAARVLAFGASIVGAIYGENAVHDIIASAKKGIMDAALGALGALGCGDDASDAGPGSSCPGGVGGPYDPNNPGRLAGPFGGAPSRPYDPLVLDLNGNGVELTSITTNHAFFDLDVDNFAEHVGWVAPDDALLARDLNGNGAIDNASELFGSATTNGFTALTALDDNHDGRIDSNDAAFSQLKVWRDLNQDGISGSDELFALPDLGVQSLSLASTATSQTVNGNTITALGSFTRADGTTGVLGAANLAIDQTVTTYVGDYTPDIETLSLPMLRGYGQVADLYVAMSQDPTLKEMVKQFAALDLSQSSQFASLADNILLRWAGTDTIAANSRGNYFDARKLTALERFFAQPYLQQGNPNPGPTTTADLNQAWTNFRDIYLPRLVVLGPAASLFPLAQVDLYNDTITLPDGLNGILSAASATEPEGLSARLNYWHDRAVVLGMLAPLTGVSASALQTALDQKFAGTELGFVHGQFLTPFVVGTSDADTLTATDPAGNAFIGSTGDDTLIGGNGADRYYFNLGDGKDTITENSTSGAVDTLFLGAGVAPSDVSLANDQVNLIMTIGANGDQITLTNWMLGSQYQIEQVAFADGTVWNAQTLFEKNNTVMGTDGADLIPGTSRFEAFYGGAGDDTLGGGYGTADYGGWTTIDGVYRGNDYHGGAGNDLLRGTTYADWYYFGIGDGQDTIVESGDPSNRDRIVLGVGIAPSDVYITRSGSDAVVRFFSSPGDQITIQGRFNHSYNKVEDLAFADGTIWNLDYTGLTVFGSDGNDTLAGSDNGDTLRALAGNDTLDGGNGYDIYYGDAGDDTLGGVYNSSDYNSCTSVNNVYRGNDYHGGTGNDLLRGSNYADRYYFDLGDGQDIIDDYSGDSSCQDQIILGAGISAANVALSNDGTNLYIKLGNGGDQIKVNNWFLGNRYDVESLQFADGTTWNRDNLQAKASYSQYGDDADNTQTGGAEWNTYYGKGGSDTLGGVQGSADWSGSTQVGNLYRGNDYFGGTGNDLLRGSNFSDQYFFQVGDSQDVIVDHSFNGVDAARNSDTIIFGSGINPNTITLDKTAGALNIHYGQNDQITINNWDSGTADQIEKIQAGDGSVLTNINVDRLIQAMATFCASHGDITWNQAVAQYGDETRAVLAASWQAAA